MITGKCWNLIEIAARVFTELNECSKNKEPMTYVPCSQFAYIQDTHTCTSEKRLIKTNFENPTFAILSELQFNGLFLTQNQYTNRKKWKWQINQKKYSKHTVRFMKKSWRVIKNRVLRCLFLKLEEFPTKKTKPNKCCYQYTKNGVNLQQIFCLCHNKAANPPIWYQPCKTELRMRLSRTKMCSFWTNHYILGRNKRLFT